jgi:hypothetical protein
MLGLFDAGHFRISLIVVKMSAFRSGREVGSSFVAGRFGSAGDLVVDELRDPADQSTRNGAGESSSRSTNNRRTDESHGPSDRAERYRAERYDGSCCDARGDPGDNADNSADGPTNRRPADAAVHLVQHGVVELRLARNMALGRDELLRSLNYILSLVLVDLNAPGLRVSDQLSRRDDFRIEQGGLAWINLHGQSHFLKRFEPCLVRETKIVSGH